MSAIPAPTTDLHREEWEDADFDIPEGQGIHAGGAESDRDDDEDWDMEMDLEKTEVVKQGVTVAKQGVVANMTANFQSLGTGKGSSPMITIRPPIIRDESTTEEDEDDEEGVSTIKATISTIKASVFPKPSIDTQTPAIDEDMESAFALPSDLTQLSLAPLNLNHRSSKNSLEWGDKDQTSSSHSSDTFSSLGIAGASPTSTSATSQSLPDTESDCDEDDSELEGLIFPDSMSSKHLKKMLEMKKKVHPINNGVKVASPPDEDNFEDGLIIDDEADLSASRLMQKTQQPRVFARSKSAPVRPPTLTRPSSRLRLDRAKSPVCPPQSSAKQLQKLKASSSTSPPPKPTRSQTYRDPPPPLPSTSFLSPKPGSLRGQKSHSGLSVKPPTPPSVQRKLTRKASLSSLMETSQSQALGSGPPPTAGPSTNKLARYEVPTAASRAKSHTNSTSRIHTLESMLPPSRPSTPSSNPVALRLTMPTSMRAKLRPALSAVFPAPSPSSAGGPSAARAPSPLPPRAPSRPPSSLSLRSRSRQSLNATPSVLAPIVAPPKVLRRPKRQRMYGDGTELDAIDDLPTDRDKEGQFRVVPKGYGNRVPGGTYSSKQGGDKDKGTLRRKTRRDSESQSDSPDKPLASATNTLKRTGRIEFTTVKSPEPSTRKKKKDDSGSPNALPKKPTLIRNLGGTGAPKVVGDMKWNPTSLRWEGNDQALKEFDAAIGTSTRPALITHLTGSSIGSPVGAGSFATGARKVGNMVFDPSRMCWISTVEEEEQDVFADMADDENDWEAKGGTIRASLPLTAASSDTSATSSASQAPSPAPSRTRTQSRAQSESGSERGSRASMVCEVDESFFALCHQVEDRHRGEMKGWRVKRPENIVEPTRSHLYEIRALATRKY